MIKYLSILILMMAAISCGTKKAQETADNQLSEQQKADGWKLLFDGKTMDGWRTFKNKENTTWEITGGMLHSKNTDDSTARMRADLITKEQYQNFELSADWKTTPRGNSGIIYRVTEEYEVPYGSGPEYQILDDPGYPEEKDVHMTGSNYDVHAPTAKVLNPLGEWNTSKIIVNGNHVEHWLNGTKVVEYEFQSEDWKAKVAASKWKDFPGYGQAPTGYIDLQDHGHETWFKNIMIKVL